MKETSRFFESCLLAAALMLVTATAVAQNANQPKAKPQAARKPAASSSKKPGAQYKLTAREEAIVRDAKKHFEAAKKLPKPSEHMQKKMQSSY